MSDRGGYNQINGLVTTRGQVYHNKQYTFSDKNIVDIGTGVWLKVKKSKVL